MPAKLYYSRYYTEHVQECESVRDAARLAIYEQDDGQMYAFKIEDKTGATVWERTGPWNAEDSERLEWLAESQSSQPVSQ